MLEYFVFQDDGTIKRIPVSTLEKLRRQAACIPEFAGKRVRVAEVWKETTETGAPESVERIGGFYLVFDKDGFVEETAQSEAIELAIHSLGQGMRSRDEPVVNLQARAKKRTLDQKYRWEPTPAERQQIAAAALGHPRRIVNVKSVKRPQVTGPVVSLAARNAYDSISEHAWRFRFEVGNLKEAELLGLKQLVEERLREDNEQEPIWRAVLEVAEQERSIRQVRRTGDGEWYAVVELFKWSEVDSGEVVKEWSQRCPTRDEAIELVHQLTAENAHHIGKQMSLEARVLSVLEWDEDR
jgi:hypothetical protein